MRVGFVLLIIFTFTLGLVAADDSTGYIKARGKPGAAGVFVDGKYIGPAVRFTVPEKYAVAPGEHEVVFRDPRYEEFSTKVTVTAGKTTKIKFSLKKLEPPKGPFGRLRFGGGEPESFISVTAGDTGAIYINDKYWGHIDEFNNAGGGMLLVPGTYKLRVESPLFGNFTRDVTIEANKVTVLPLNEKK